MIQTDYYELLGVTPRAHDYVIKAAYGALMKHHHPDNGGDLKTAQALGHAYGILSDPDKRAKYDRDRFDPASLLANEYKIIELISDTGLGATYKAEDSLLEQTVCIKHCTNISPEADEFLLNEVRNLRRLRHAGLPSVFRVFRLPDGSLAFAMSFIPGYNLEEAVKKAGPLDPEDVAWIGERSLNTLRYMHYFGSIHGDVKPQKIIVDDTDHSAVLVGHGLSMFRPKAGEKAKGYTPYFSPPEAKNGEMLCPQSDLYSLGLSMIYALSGDLRRVENREVPSKVPKPMKAFIARLVEDTVALRPRWENTDLFEEIKKIREESFGRARSGMKRIRGL